MAFSKVKKEQVYRKLFGNFLKGEYISKAREGVDISKVEVENICKRLSKQGYIFLTCGNKGRTFVNFTSKGEKLLSEYFNTSM